ncbi:Heterokaryon incompatibility protein (HET) domain containing protein [Hyaloscypha variabilis]
MSSDPSISSDLDSQPTSQWEACIRSISRTSANPAAPSIANPYFDYVPLELRSHDIRLFSLFPADNFADEITGGLFHASLDSPPPYETVSYVWGDASICENIQLRYISSRSHPKHGTHEESFTCVPVTTNLALLLRNLRHSVISRLLWIDAICINQYDNDEKGHQVQLMATIYKLGARSTVWLGEERAGSTNALHLVDNCVQMAHPAIFIGEAEDEQSNESYDSDDREEHQQEEPLYLTRTECECLKSILDHRDIWFRIWILQEIIFAPKPVLMCGSDVLPWDSLAAFLRVVRSAKSFFETKSVEHALLMDKQRRIFQAQGKRKITEGTLLSLLGSTESFRSSDERDKLYALLNITNDHLEIVPDYGISAAEMWVSAVKVFIRSEKHLIPFRKRPLIFASEIQCLRELPSWLNLATADGTILQSSSSRLTGDEENHALISSHVPSELLNELSVESILLTKFGDNSQYSISFHDLVHIRQTRTNELLLFLIFRDTTEDSSGLWSMVLQVLLPEKPWGIDDSKLGCFTMDESRQFREMCEATIRCKGDKDSCYLSVSAADLLELETYRTDFNALFNHHLIITDSGLIAVLTTTIIQGDEIHIVLGSPAVLVLRPISKMEGRYKVIGESFVYLPCIQRKDAPPNTTVFGLLGLLEGIKPIGECRYREMGLGQFSRITLV